MRVCAPAAAALLLAALLGGCASPPIETDVSAGVPSSGGPLDAATEPAATDGAKEGERVLWGGTIVGARNLGEGTELEVLAYPLDRRQRPMRGRAAAGRFLVLSDDYLETLDYAEGRLLTVLGTREGMREGRVGEARYEYPVVRAETLHLWRPEGQRQGVQPSFGIGIGVTL